LISGASIAGLSSAFWLQRAGWDVTVLERAESFRDGGQNIDVRGVAREVLDRMGLTEQVRAQNTTEEGTVFVDADDQPAGGEFPEDGSDGPTAELEILRGDLARIILDHLPARPEMIFGDQVAAVRERADGVDIELASGRRLSADLLVVAEGVRSATRDLLFGDAVERHELGINMAFGTIAREEGDGHLWRWFNAPGGRQANIRPDNKGTTRALLGFMSGEQNLAELDRPEALRELRRVYEGAGWKVPRILDGFDTSDDVYIDYLTQIRLPSWSRGHVCLVGDAAWCVTPIGGRGSSLALTGGYVLAAYLSQADPGDLGPALERYEKWLRPSAEKAQHLPPGVPRAAYPQTAAGVGVERLVTRALSTRPLSRLLGKLAHDGDTDQGLPELRPGR
jgi:2-polyprenyl-6-methoxyphenol hydroxylase-like FAD-dependent oxidoreductase